MQRTLRAKNFVVAVGGRPRFPKEVSKNNRYIEERHKITIKLPVL